ncbi:hypothetical protein EDD15DRAFT_2365900 [Pisolithus albus]|nr:hypothetical protein EDD15DRAFT_2365900 [Pisolithus albus]
MPSNSRVRGHSDKENADATRGLEGTSSRSRRPSEKLKQMTAEQQELAERREIRTQRERKRLQLRQLADEGSDIEEREVFAGDDRYDIDDDNDDEDNGSQFTSRVIATKLSGVSKERLSYSKHKIPRAPPPTIDVEGEIAASDDDELEEPYSTPHSSSDRQSTQHKKSKEGPRSTSTSEVEGSFGDNVVRTTKRRRDSSKEVAVVPVAVKAQKLVQHEGRPRTRDYDDTTQEFMTIAIGEYRARLCAEAPMPDHITETSVLNAAWACACKATQMNLTRTPELAKIITSRGSQVRGQLKTKLRPLVEAIFGFHSSQTKSAIKKNRSLAESLKEGTNFAFKHMAADEDGRRGFLKAPLIQKIVNTMWFANKHDDGVVFHNHYNPFPNPTLALVLTAIECCIDEWMTGTHQQDGKKSDSLKKSDGLRKSESLKISEKV